MSAFEALLSHIRLSSVMMGIGATLAGTACAALVGQTEYVPASLCAIFAIFAQISGNFYYRYYEVIHTKGFVHNKQRTKIVDFSSDGFLKESSIAFFLLALLCSLAIIPMGGWWTFVVGIFILILGWLTMGGSLPLLYTPYGIICPFILFGPVCVLSTSLLQVQHDNGDTSILYDMTPALYMSIVIGLMCVNATILYSYSNYYIDKRRGKHTFVATIGRKASRTVFLINAIISTAISVAMCVMLHVSNTWLDMVPSIICMLVYIYIWIEMWRRPRYQLHTLTDIGNFNVLLMGLLTLIIYELTGNPDTSTMTFFGI